MPKVDVWAHLKPGPFIRDRRPTRAETAACLAMLQEARAMLSEARHHQEGYLAPHIQGLAGMIDASVVEIRPYSRGPFSWLRDRLSIPSFLDQTDYIGAVDPDAATAWWEGWTLDGTL